MPLYTSDLLNNVTIYGSPTINGHVFSNFSGSNYLKTIPAQFTEQTATADNWEMVFKIKYVADSSAYQNIWIQGAAYATKLTIETDGKAQLYVNNSGTSTAIGWAKTSTLTNGNTYWIKAEFTGTAYNIYLSTDGVNWEAGETISSSTKITDRGINSVGANINDGTNYKQFKGEIDLSESYIKVNGEYWWKGIALGFVKIKELYKGSTKIKELYKGGTLVFGGGYPSGTVLIEKSSAGTYSLVVDYNCTVHVDLVGGGSGATYGYNSSTRKKGGSGAYISGTMSLTAGTYSIVVGAGSAGVKSTTRVSAGDNSTFNGNTAGGAPSWYIAYGNSTGGTATVVSTGLSGQNGSGQNSTGWINGYGAGGNTTNNQAATINGKDGYCKIYVV